MGKSRVAVRLKDKAGKKSHNRSEDLARLTEQYNVFIKRLEGLVGVSLLSFGTRGKDVSCVRPHHQIGVAVKRVAVVIDKRRTLPGE